MTPLKFFRRIWFILILLVFLPLTVFSQDEWIQARSKNFNLIGNAAEKDIREVACKLEEFREVLSRSNNQFQINSAVPTTVVVFKNSNDYKPFKPTKENGETKDYIKGFFQAGKDVNYISLSVDAAPERNYQIIFHEYTHFLIRNNLGESIIPPWYNEGLAVYYETFSFDNNQKINLGAPQAAMLALLRRSELIPFETFFNYDNLSLHEQGEESIGLFYAQSWALMHFLIHGNNGARKPQLGQFLKLVLNGKNSRQAFTEAFQADFQTIEYELKKYIESKTFAATTYSLPEKLNLDRQLQVNPLSTDQREAFLGDLLLHIGRLKEAEIHLKQSLAENPVQNMAQASLGLLRLKENNVTEAINLLEKAAASESANYLVHFYYAYALSRIGMIGNGVITSYDPQTAQKMRDSLKKAIELKPDFAEAYDLYAFVNLIRSQDLEEAIEYENKALELAPGNQWYLIHLAELFLGKEDFLKARAIAAKVATTAGEKDLKVYAQNALQRIISVEEAYEDIKNNRNRQEKNPLDRDLTDEELAALRARQIVESLNESLYKPKAGETRILGNIFEIDCNSREVIFQVKTADKILKLKNTSFDSVRFVSFNLETAFAQINCGAFKKEALAVINFRPLKDLKTNISGEIISVEFVPENFRFVGQ